MTKPDRRMTVKLDSETYQRVRRFAFNNEMSHQSVIEEALKNYLDNVAPKTNAK